MLVIRMQRTGRKGHAMFRVVVQDSRRTPTSGKIVASLGSYDPHSKTASLNKEKAQFYLEHGAQPSERVARLFQAEKIELPKWVSLSSGKKREVRNPDKRRSTRPEEPAEEAEVPAEAPVEAGEAASAEEVAETPVAEETATEETPAAEEPVEEEKA
jgi:small subunit ribosomal protein S16